MQEREDKKQNEYKQKHGDATQNLSDNEKARDEDREAQMKK